MRTVHEGHGETTKKIEVTEIGNRAGTGGENTQGIVSRGDTGTDRALEIGIEGVDDAMKRTTEIVGGIVTATGGGTSTRHRISRGGATENTVVMRTNTEGGRGKVREVARRDDGTTSAYIIIYLLNLSKHEYP